MDHLQFYNSHTKKGKNANHIMNYIFGVMLTAFVIIILAFFLFSCSNDNESAKVEVRLTDAPGDFQEVNVDIQAVEVHGEEGGWRALDVENGVYNLLELSNGLDPLLATAEFPASKISQIRLILGNNNTVKVNGVLYNLSTPSAQQSGLKLNKNANLKPGILYVFTLDFDAALSIVKQGNGTYSLKPVIRALSEATSGAISGVALPLLATPAVFVIHGSDTVATTYTNDLGNFLVQGVPAGTYVVSFSPKVGYASQQRENVVVTIGNVTDLGVITIQ